MSKLNELATIQSDIGKAITQLFENFKKEKLERRTADNTKAYQQKLGELWAKFNQTHEALQQFKEQHPDHGYFIKNYFMQVQQEYNQFSSKILERLENTIELDTSQTAKLIRQQEATITALERIISATQEQLSGPQSRAFYSQKLKMISDYWAEIASQNRKLSAEVNQASYNIERYNHIEDQYQAITIRLQERLDSQTANASTTSNVKLPKITLPIFDGSFLKWKQFKDLFIQLIHNSSLSAAEKIYYLKGNVTGEPDRLIRHLQATESNYSLAWKILMERYDNSRAIVTVFLNELLSQAPLTSENATGIKKLHDTSKECLLSLENMGIQIKEWSPILVHVLLQKLDKESRRLYEQTLKAPRELQKIEDFFLFLESRFQTLESFNLKEERKKPSTLVVTTKGSKCPLCKAEHKIFQCNKFLYTSLENRRHLAKQYKLCLNCLKSGHIVKDCLSRGCTKCNERHNTLLHNPQENRQPKGNAVTSNQHETTRHDASTLQKSRKLTVTPPPREIEQTSTSRQNSGPRNISLNASTRSTILLATAVINVVNPAGTSMPCRVILDSGSQLHFITERLTQVLGLKRHKINFTISGIGGLETTAKYETTLTIQSKVNDFSLKINAVVLPRISDYQPTTYIEASSWNIPANIQLADPGFFEPQAIDMLLGADLYFQLLSEGQIRLSNNLPLLQNTQLGWIITGRIPQEAPSHFQCHIATQPSFTALENQLKQFWELEQHDSPVKPMTKEEHECENHFQITFQRTPDGKFLVKLPFKEQSSSLGSSLEMATKRFYALERKLDRHPELRKQYNEFMSEYETLGHMQPISRKDIPALHYYLPHHCVVKPDSSTTKLRVVFDASAKTSSGKSLNDLLMVGPTVQSELFSILIKFRMHKYVLTADICKMYRQILLHPEDRNFQLILWRSKKEDPLKTYQLNTVTYGTATAPYIATRCLNQLALSESDSSPDAASVLQNDAYVDDILTGADTMESILQLKTNLIQLLKSGGFELRKFCSNHPGVISDLPEECKEKMLIVNESEIVKTLGLMWQPTEDVFRYRTNHIQSDKITKRIILSDVSRIFDPLGLIGPVTVLGKLFVQDLWKLNLSWDENLPTDLRTRWHLFQTQLEELKDLRIPRYVSETDPVEFQLHAFSDSSESAYGACCYLRTVNDLGEIKIHLLCAKSRLAPLRTTTLARLELSAAVLMVELVERIRRCLPKTQSTTFYYTDSTIVLSWIAAPSYTWSTFVANRIEKIQQLTSKHEWNHIEGSKNPADIISRGMLPGKLRQSTLWFKGPDFLSQPAARWPKQTSQLLQNAPERRTTRLALSVKLKPEENVDLITPVNHRNSFTRLQRIFAYCFRFYKNCKLPRVYRTTGHLTLTEMDTSLNGMIHNVQHTSFINELKILKQNKPLSGTIQSLNPYVDSTTNIIRVGGRLKHSELSEEARNQALLPKNHKFSELLATHLHKQHMHAGPQTLTAIVRQRYWIIDVRTLARQTVHKCIRCFHCKPTTISQIMGDLPAKRVTPARPFYTTGIDFCGPIMIYHKLKRKVPDKAYIAVFVCFTTKAIHLEVVSDLSATSFLNALKRFIARRGLCATIYCDNATNFVGARSQLRELEEVFKSQDLQTSIADLCLQNHIEWKPIPPRSPHFGGLWEAAVKAAKGHLLRQVGNSNLTYEELHTIIAQIEAILNSRPLTPMSADPNDLEALTPGHFLTGSPLTSFAEPDVSEENINRLTRFRRLQHIQQNFWKRWSAEYLQELQVRQKWKSQQPDIKPGTLVLIKDNNLPPLKWALGRVIDTVPGPDNHTRVVNVKTEAGPFKRSIHNLCPLPIDEEKIAELDCKVEEKKQGTCLLLEKEPPTDLPSKRRKINFSETRPHHPLRGRFLPINSNWKPYISELSKKGNSEEDLDSNTQPAQIQRKRRIHSSAALSLLLMTSLVLPIFGNPLKAPVEVTPFNNNPGIYFESLGQAQIINSEWNILVYYNLANYWSEFQGIKTCLNEIQNLCNVTTVKKNHCLDILAHFQHQLKHIEDANEILYNRSGGRRNINKRSPFNFIGTVANNLFGLLDSDYANHIEGEIEKSRNNEAYLMQLIKNQTSVLEATANVIKSKDNFTQQQFQSIQNHIQALYKYLDKSEYEQQASQTFTSLVILTSLALQNYEKTQNMILDVLTDLHHNKINPLLLTPSQLRGQLSLIKENIPSALTIPGYGTGGSLLLYNLITAAARVTESNVLFDIRVPLQHDEYFQLFQLIPVPILHENNVILMEPSTKYLIVNLSRDKYYPITQLEFDKCNHLNDGRYICKQNHPIYNLRSNVSHCEMELLNHRQTLSPTCRFQNARQSKIWIQLHAPNNWLFSLDTEITVNVVCGTEVSLKTISGTGILKLRPDCLIRQTSMTISGHGRYESKITSSFIPHINVSELLENHFSPDKKLTHSISEPHLQGNTRELSELTAKIDVLKTATAIPNKLNSHDVHHYTISYVLVSALLTGFGYLLYSRWRRLKAIRRPTSIYTLPVPANRTRRQPNEDFVLHSNSRGEDVSS